MKETWEKELGENQQNVTGAMKGVMSKLSFWNKNVLGVLEKRISRLKKELEVWRKKEIGPEQVSKEEMLPFKLSRLEDQLDLYWKQRAHVHWLKCGDSNTKKIHSWASERRRQNRLKN